jgi:hypothetical protein
LGLLTALLTVVTGVRLYGDGMHRIGVAAPLWVNRSGEVVGAPGRTTDAVGRAAVGAAGILLVGPLILAGSWAGVRVGHPSGQHGAVGA